jgi:hypothetical protein
VNKEEKITTIVQKVKDNLQKFTEAWRRKQNRHKWLRMSHR